MILLQEMVSVRLSTNLTLSELKHPIHPTIIPSLCSCGPRPPVAHWCFSLMSYLLSGDLLNTVTTILLLAELHQITEALTL